MSHPTDARIDLLHPELQRYLDELSPAPDPLLERMERIALARGFPLVGRQAGRWLELLTRMVGARRVLELGSGFGYSAAWLARGVGPDGVVLGCEHDPASIVEHRELFAGHPLAPRVRIEQGEALVLLERAVGRFDLVFLDIEKEDYPAALELAVPRIRPGGLLVADNALWGGLVCRPPGPGDAATAGLRRFNELLHRDPRLLAGLLPADDGLAVALVLGG